MKVFLVIFLIPLISFGQTKIESGAYRFGVKLDGPTTLLQQLSVHHQRDNDPHGKHAGEEELLIVKEGKLKTTINGNARLVGPGSIIYIMPGEDHAFVSVGDSLCRYYLLRYKTGKPPVESDKSYPSFIVDWNEMKFVPHDKGGRREVVDHRTRLFERFEMHVTTLKEGLSSHDPHTHTPEEIIIIKEGDVEMNVGDKKVKASAGDLIFLDSKVSHNLTNIGSKPTTYFAFQWN